MHQTTGKQYHGSGFHIRHQWRSHVSSLLRATHIQAWVHKAEFPAERVLRIRIATRDAVHQADTGPGVAVRYAVVARFEKLAMDTSLPVPCNRT